ncbi:hypothetical protein ACFL3X_00055 [Gemmatimonadota bacterium]
MSQDEWKDVSGYNLDLGEDGLEIIDDGYRKYRQPDAIDPEKKAAQLAKARQRLILTIAIFGALFIGLILLNPGGGGETLEERLAEITTLDEASYLFAMEDTFAVGHIQRQFRGVGDQLQFNDGVVVNYLFLERPVEIWVGISLLQELAAEAFTLLLEETDPALNPESGWRAQSQFQRSGRTITQVVGKGQRHYFYTDSNMVIWVAADSIAGTYALNAVMNTNIRNWLDRVRQGGR